MNIREILENTATKDLIKQIELLQDQSDNKARLLKELIEIELRYRAK